PPTLLIHSNSRINLSHSELKSLNELEKRLDILIRPADKGGSIVVMSTDKYNLSIMSQLNDKDCYTPLIHNPLKQHEVEIDQLLEKALHRGWITVKHPVCPMFYGLPKIHKSLIDPPLRPIVSSIGCLTEPLSQYLDFFLKKYVYKDFASPQSSLSLAEK
uniref:Uncharacterized protein n=1 Tax=Cyprinus carpio TaxID=7962 RepID=A0A8C2DIT0_CYPCA